MNGDDRDNKIMKAMIGMSIVMIGLCALVVWHIFKG
jgi:hypothetical protein